MQTVTLSVPRAAELLGVSPTTTYRAIQDGSFPFPAFKVGSRYVIPAKPVMEAFGLDELPQEAA